MSTTLENPRHIKAFTNAYVEIPEELKVLSGTEKQPRFSEGAKGNCWRIMTKEDGDKRVVWDSHSIPQINAAKKLFEELQREGMEAYKVGVNGESTSEKMTSFDPSAEAVIFLPMKQVVGG